MKPTDEKATKRNPIVTKLLDLKYRINDHYKATGGKINTKTDKSWVMQMIDNVRSDMILSKDEMTTANELWRKYE